MHDQYIKDLEEKLKEAEECLLFLKNHSTQYEIGSMIDRTVNDYFEKYPDRRS